jgi:hypothetical protein
VHETVAVAAETDGRAAAAETTASTGVAAAAAISPNLLTIE